MSERFESSSVSSATPLAAMTTSSLNSMPTFFLSASMASSSASLTSWIVCSPPRASLTATGSTTLSLSSASVADSASDSAFQTTGREAASKRLRARASSSEMRSSKGVSRRCAIETECRAIL